MANRRQTARATTIPRPTGNTALRRWLKKTEIKHGLFLKQHKEVLLVIAASILFPCFQALGGYLSTTITEAEKNRTQLIKEFSQNYSLYLSYADEYYLMVCEKGKESKKQERIGKGEATEGGVKGNYEFRVELKKKMLDVRQPDAMLTIIQYDFYDKEIQYKAKKLAGITAEVADCLQCRKSGSHFNDEIEKANDLYVDLLKLMSKYGFISSLLNNLFWGPNEK